jgi:hypothetical protein
MSREQFAFQTKLGSSTIDKLCSGRFSETTLQIVQERTKFVKNNSYAAKQLGGYARAAWEGYLREYLYLRPSIAGNDIEAEHVAIEWNDGNYNTLPGLVLIHCQTRTVIGTLAIPHERSPLIYIQPINLSPTLIVSTMVGEAAMRGLMLGVINPVANAHAPVAMPVIFRRMDEKSLRAAALGTIPPIHSKYSEYQAELQKTLDKQYGQLIQLPATVGSVGPSQGKK